MFEADLREAAQRVVDYLERQRLRLLTAESCTGGHIAALLSAIPGSGQVMEGGLVVYSPTAKRELLGVEAMWLEDFNLTSVEVARAMAEAALRYEPATAVLAVTGLLDEKGKDGIPPGTVCLAWGYRMPDGLALFTRRVHFTGDAAWMRHQTVRHALELIPEFHRRALAGERR
ncbi:CinA family protein [Pseudomonas sp. NY15437]|uniref:CinA family protein n=1 Tax=unclassified Pseudomonas TaxID=196821 RepID=UPI00223B5473|nr:CinA family protein [Pseudomonas sp. GCEP-101]